jgi:hypothetical protein
LHVAPFGSVKLPPEAYRPKVPERDREYERAFLDHVVSLAEHLGAGESQFAEYVFQRTDSVGARSYGDTSFLSDDRDLIRELRDEAFDLCVYAMFEAEKRRLTEVESEDDEITHHLSLAAAHAAVADYHASIVQRLAR